MKCIKFNYISSIILIVISILILPFIEFNSEYIFNMFRFILIRLFKIKPTTDINIELVLLFVMLGYTYLNYKFQKTKSLIIINQILLIGYLIVNIYPITFGKHKLLNTSSVVYFFTNIIIIVVLSLINIYRIKINSLD